MIIYLNTVFKYMIISIHCLRELSVAYRSVKIEVSRDFPQIFTYKNKNENHAWCGKKEFEPFYGAPLLQIR